MPDAHQFEWATCPEVATFLNQAIKQSLDGNAFAKNIAVRFLKETGTRFFDWVDHVVVSEDQVDTLEQLGFRESNGAWHFDAGLFPTVRIGDQPCVAIKVESVHDFAMAHQLNENDIQGRSGGQFRHIVVPGEIDFCAVERHGYTGFKPNANSESQCEAARSFYDAVSTRKRDSHLETNDFKTASELLSSAADSIGMDWACDIFFRAEREYWTSRNHAAQIQKQRQDVLGVGWANHDHHTYRSGREYFARLVAVLELMGFECRERFYAGEQAGWGAQVLEHPTCGIVIFADVDMTPEEVTGDFSHDGLPTRSKLGTVGLWCKLHGDSFLQAGLHHLECQFDFDAAREQLAAEQIETMAPFTDFKHLRQAFTHGETWAVDQIRIDRLIEEGSITREEGQAFSENGAIGSHLEILERNDGFKGFNQTGISHIIEKTDPRNH